MMLIKFAILPEVFALARLSPDAPLPAWPRGRFVSMTRGSREITIVCAEGEAPAGAETRGGYRCLEILGEYEPEAVGVVAAATAPLARAGVSVFVFSAWSTDFLLVAEVDLGRAQSALRHAGHAID